ncbi:MAG: hypothetical protein J6U90_03880 [Methanobrevibacter sp.]|nr:hypothetical protein [Methanobrevibacter sp.]
MGLNINFYKRKKLSDETKDLLKRIFVLQQEFYELKHEIVDFDDKLFELLDIKCEVDNILSEINNNDITKLISVIINVDTNEFDFIIKEYVLTLLFYFNNDMNFLLPYFNYTNNNSYNIISKQQIEDLICDIDIINNNISDINIIETILPLNDTLLLTPVDITHYYDNVNIIKEKFIKLLDTFDFDNYEIVMFCSW